MIEPAAADLHERLHALALNPVMEQLFDICEEIEQRPDGRDFVPGLLAILEANSDFDFGSPGPITATAEKFTYGAYEQELIASVRRAPTFYTIWMANRLANGTDGLERDIYIALLRHIAADERLTPYLRDRAQDYLTWQEG